MLCGVILKITPQKIYIAFVYHLTVEMKQITGTLWQPSRCEAHFA